MWAALTAFLAPARVSPRDTRSASIISGLEAVGIVTGPTGWDRYVIAPENRLKACFDIVVALSIFYAVVIYPIDVAFSLHLLPPVTGMVDAIFVGDVFLNFVHGYYEMGFRRMAVRSLKRVAINYVANPANVVPDLLGLVAILHRVGPQVAWLQLLSLARLFRLRRLARRWRFLSGSGNYLRVGISLVLWVLACHWLGCIFFLLGWRSTCASLPDTWVTVHWPVLRAACNATHLEAPMDFERLGGPSTATMYVQSLYWALATTSSLGYGSGPTAITNVESVLAICAQVGGACLSAIIFSNVAQVINKGDAASTRYETQLESINEFVRFHRMPPAIRNKLHGYHDLLFSISHGFDLQQIAAIFPKNVQEDTFFFMYQHIVRKVPMFAATDNNFIRALVRMLQPQVLLGGDFAFRYGEMGETMHFLQTGVVQIGMVGPVGDSFSAVYATMKPGAYFGELALFTKQRRTASARALSDCTLYNLTQDDFAIVIDQHPHYYETIVDNALERLRALQDENKATDVRAAVVNEMTAMIRSRAQVKSNDRRKSRRSIAPPSSALAHRRSRTASLAPNTLMGRMQRGSVFLRGTSARPEAAMPEPPEDGTPSVDPDITSERKVSFGSQADSVDGGGGTKSRTRFADEEALGSKCSGPPVANAVAGSPSDNVCEDDAVSTFHGSCEKSSTSTARGSADACQGDKPSPTSKPCRSTSPPVHVSLPEAAVTLPSPLVPPQTPDVPTTASDTATTPGAATPGGWATLRRSAANQELASNDVTVAREARRSSMTRISFRADDADSTEAPTDPRLRQMIKVGTLAQEQAKSIKNLEEKVQELQSGMGSITDLLHSVLHRLPPPGCSNVGGGRAEGSIGK